MDRFRDRLRCGPLPPPVTNIVRADHEDDFLGHVGRMVGDALKVLGHPNDTKPGQYLAGVVGDVRRHRRNDGRKVQVDRIVATEDAVGGGVVPPHESIERTMKHVEHRTCHRSELTVDELFRICLVPNGPLADVDRFVADALEIRDEPQRGCEKPQIVGNGLP
jgi:hypothetical protein